MNEIKLSGKLANAEVMLKEVFSDECRPSLRWLRTQTKAQTIPCVRIGHLVLFDLEKVRAYVAERRLECMRGGGECRAQNEVSPLLYASWALAANFFLRSASSSAIWIVIVLLSL